jgi:nitric oxide reductase large subunit
MWSQMAVVLLPVMLVLVGVALLVWRMLRERDSRRAPTDDGQPRMLLGLLMLAAFAMGAFLTYALLNVR